MSRPAAACRDIAFFHGGPSVWSAAPRADAQAPEDIGELFHEQADLGILLFIDEQGKNVPGQTDFRHIQYHHTAVHVLHGQFGHQGRAESGGCWLLSEQKQLLQARKCP